MRSGAVSISDEPRRDGVEKSATLVIAVNRLFADCVFKAGNGAHHVLVFLTDALLNTQRSHERRGSSEQRHNEASIAPTGTEANVLGL
jgi:hypothetical protein